MEMLPLSLGTVARAAATVLSPGLFVPHRRWSSSRTVSAGHWLRQGWARLPVPIAAGSCESNQGLALWGQQPNRMGCGTGDLIPVGSKEQRAGRREDIGGAMRLPRPRGGG